MYRYLLIIFFFLSACCAKKNTSDSSKSEKLRFCPDEWIENKMPSTDPQKNNQYFIVKGERRELEEFDLDWIKKNCNLKVQTVY